MSKKEFIKYLKNEFNKEYSPEFLEGINFDEGFTADYITIVFSTIITTSFLRLMFEKGYIFYISTRDDMPVMRVAVPDSDVYEL